jgi:hypothetical protein
VSPGVRNMEQRPEEIAQLQARAQHALEHLAALEPCAPVQQMRQVLRLWHEPAFGTPKAWALFEHVRLPSDPSTRLLPAWMLVREATWDRPQDMGRFADPLQGLREGFDAPPTITVRDGQIAQEAVMSWLQEMAQLPIALFGVEAPWGIDGETWGLEVRQPFLHVRLQWWGAGPTPWAELTRAVAHLREQLTDTVRPREAAT